ncbi:hypothetical protein QP158_10720, partial [Streptococcus agalactiae]|uniref:hypothetical protein n=1 Tax=Streptococcus agalactiae TaxID=1311 RepID=UPI002552CDF0
MAIAAPVAEQATEIDMWVRSIPREISPIKVASSAKEKHAGTEEKSSVNIKTIRVTSDTISATAEETSGAGACAA